MTSMILWATLIGTGIGIALIAYPVMYLALADHYKASLSGVTNVCLFVVTVPLIGLADLAFGGGDPRSYGGLLVLLVMPLVVCFVVIGAAFENQADRAKTPPSTTCVAASIKESLRRFGRPAERLAFALMVVGLCLLIGGLLLFWVRRGFYVDQLKYDFVEIFFESSSYYRYGWSQWLARVGVLMSIVGFAIAFHYNRIVSPLSRIASGVARWVRTGE
ncbi:MAG: hypothetical protein ACT4P9_06780 [Betaproteobacteria bacterium]